MPNFFYKAKKNPREFIEGRIEAESEYIAVQKLFQLGYYPVRVEKEKNASSERKFYPAFLGRGPGIRDMAVFTSQLSDLLGSGLTLLNALNVLYEQTENRYLKSIIRDMIAVIRDGAALSAALSKYPKIFPRIFVSMVHSGEVGGVLENVLRRLSQFYEKDEEVKSKIQSAMAYPILVLSVGALTIFVLLSFVVPKIASIFVEFGQALPLPTAILISVSDFFSKFWWLLLSFFIVVAFLLNRIYNAKEGKARIDAFILNFPGIGEFVKKIEIGRLSKSLATLLGNGVPILQAMEVVSDTVTNEVLRRQLSVFAEEIRAGSSFSNAIRASKYFPVFVINMIAVGEEGGLLDESLQKIGDSYERDTDRLIKIIISLIEPLMILGLGAAVAFIVVAMLLPIFQINLMVK